MEAVHAFIYTYISLDGFKLLKPKASSQLENRQEERGEASLLFPLSDEKISVEMIRYEGGGALSYST